MAGVKGRSGGARPNTGGARVGAGRKPAPKTEAIATDQRDPLEFLLDVMQGKVKPNADQLKAAIAATQYSHIKKSDTGKKEDRQRAAEKVAGRFAAAHPPRLVASNS